MGFREKMVTLYNEHSLNAALYVGYGKVVYFGDNLDKKVKSCPLSYKITEVYR